jgi:hypothetical protein
MQKWEYKHGIYQDGQIESHAEWSNAPSGRGLGHFLDEAGEKGWELCGVLPYPTTGKPDGTLAVIFKRPRQD